MSTDTMRHMPNKEADLAQRRKDGWWDVELFRVVHGRLPEHGDEVTKKTAKAYIDRFIFGKEEAPEQSEEVLRRFAFHVFASTNLAYKNDLD